MGRSLPVVWSAPLLDRSGFADEARSVVLALDRLGVDVRADPAGWNGWRVELAPGSAERLEHLLALEAPERFVHVIHYPPELYRRERGAALTIGRSMLETEGLPPGWAERCNALDEVWVPSFVTLETFERAGVRPDRLVRIPEGVRAEIYADPGPPLVLPQLDARFVFLSVFGWGRRKGWDVLVQAFLEEFELGEGVVLALKVEPSFGLTISDIRERLDGFVHGRLGREPHDLVLLDLPLAEHELPQLYRAADAFVLASRGEGWGRPYMEAMACGLPTIGTRWSGNLDFMSDDNSYLVGAELVDVPEEAWQEWPLYRGLRWAEPSVAELRAAMRRVVERPAEAAARGRRAREDVLSQHTAEHAAGAVIERLDALGVSPARTRARRRLPRVRWEGPSRVAFGMAVVNDAVVRALAGSGRVALGEPADVVVRHTWPPDFARPDAERFVVVQPWELGSVPRAWVEGLRTADELWVPSEYVRDCYRAAGVDRVAVVPNGVDPLRFNGAALPLPLPTRKAYRFLFVGGTIWRKGADVLLAAYLATFRREDDVCLVIRDLGADSFYRGQGLRADILRAQADPRAPEIVLLDRDLPADAMPSLYAACDCLVHPYRGEGFALPVAEAMACGLPAIVTGHGACLDYCDDETAYLLPYELARGTRPFVGELETVDLPWWAEPDGGALAAAMRRVVEDPAAARAVGARASERVLRNFTWRHAAEAAAARIESLAPRRPARRRARPTVSAAMIVRDEERFLPACLESLGAAVDELVVVDTGSTDGTVEIARGLGARIDHVPWTGDFAAARNEAIARARGDWILMLDADQRLDAASVREVRRLAALGRRRGYLLRQLNYTEAEGTDSWIEHLNLRLFPNEPGVRYAGRVHEQIEAAPPLELEATSIVVHHEGCRPGVYSLAKAARDRGVLEEMARAAPGEPFHCFNLGVACHLLGDQRAAEEALLRAAALAALANGAAPSYLVTTYHLLALVLLAQERPAEAAEWCVRALELDPDFADAHVTRGAALGRLGLLDDALASYRRALAARAAPAYGPTDRTAAGWKPLLGMAEIHLARREQAAADDALAQARALAPSSPAVAAAIAAWREPAPLPARGS